MEKLFVFIGMTVGGSIGWSIGERFGIWAAFWLSSVGTIAGVCLWWRLGRSLLD